MMPARGPAVGRSSPSSSQSSNSCAAMARKQGGTVVRVAGCRRRRGGAAGCRPIRGPRSQEGDRPGPPDLPTLLLLFRVNGVLAQPGRVLLQLQLLAPLLAPQRVIVVARFLADEKHDFDFLLLAAAGHGSLSQWINKTRARARNRQALPAASQPFLKQISTTTPRAASRRPRGHVVSGLPRKKPRLLFTK